MGARYVACGQSSWTLRWRSTTYTLDVIPGRVRSWVESEGGSPISRVNHFSGDSDVPSWTDEGDGTYSAPVVGLSGVIGVTSGSGSVVWHLVDMFGNIIGFFADGGAGIAAVELTDEYGRQLDSNQVGAQRYGWLGANLRTSDTPGGIVLMGFRAYNPGTGRFLQVDPVFGGSCNAYDYVCGDPINSRDLDGLQRPAEPGRATPVLIYGPKIPKTTSNTQKSCECVGTTSWRIYSAWRTTFKSGWKRAFPGDSTGDVAWAIARVVILRLWKVSIPIDRVDYENRTRIQIYRKCSSGYLYEMRKTKRERHQRIYLADTPWTPPMLLTTGWSQYYVISETRHINGPWRTKW